MYKLPARVLGRAELCRLLAAVSNSRHPARNRTMILLSFHAGLRACEIAGLTWPMVLGPSGKLTGSLSLSLGITKGGKPRTIPTSILMLAALRRLHLEGGKPRTGNVILLERGGKLSARSVVNWFRHTYDGVGMAEVCLHCREPADLCGPGDVPDAIGSSERLLRLAARAIKPPCG